MIKWKKLLFWVLYLVIVFSLAILISSPALSYQAEIHVPDDYSTIQAAVDAASDGDTIIIRDGDYTENIDITKSLTVQSENGAASSTVTAANRDDHVFDVSSNGVVIGGFTIAGATGENKAGIYLRDKANQCIISNNMVSENYYGIYLNSSSNNILRNNTCHSNSNEGILLLSSCNDNTIDNNTSYSCWFCSYVRVPQRFNTCTFISFPSAYGGIPSKIYRGYFCSTKEIWKNQALD